MHVSTTLTLTGDLISKIQDVSHPDEDGDSVFVDSYDGHRAYVWVIDEDKGSDRDTRRFSIEFTYEARRGARLRQGTPRIEQLIEVLSSTREEGDFDCRVIFEFGKRLKPKPIISLPMRYTESPDMPFDVIQGLHLVKIDDKKWQYDVILEATKAGVIMGNIHFTCTSEIDKALADRILERGTSIADRFVSKEQ